MRRCMNAVCIYTYIVTMCIMVNYLKPCLPFGFDKYTVPRDKNIFLCTPSLLRMTERKGADIHIYTHERALHLFS